MHQTTISAARSFDCQSPNLCQPYDCVRLAAVEWNPISRKGLQGAYSNLVAIDKSMSDQGAPS